MLALAKDGGAKFARHLPCGSVGKYQIPFK
jgi:hypothetical protein